jgi:hypothetical protein
MTFTTGTLTRCAGGNHYYLPIVIGGVTKILPFNKDDLVVDLADFDAAKAAVLARVRSAAKEAGVNTFAQAVAVVSGKTFQV